MVSDVVAMVASVFSGALPSVIALSFAGHVVVLIVRLVTGGIWR